MSISPACDFCKKELKDFGALLFSPPTKKGYAHKFHVCKNCYKGIVKLLKLGRKEIEDVLSLGPSWLNYTRKVKRKS